VTTIDHDDYQSLLAKYVNAKGRVDYQRWQDTPEDVARLDRYVASLASAPPDTRPGLYAGKSERLSYWLNLYNSIVLREVIRRYPIDSVNDVMPTATSFLKQGKGFFYDLHFQVGTREMNLLEIENEIIRGRFQDARIHFALNCASASCPSLRGDAFGSGELDAQLDEATRAFINDGANVEVDELNHRVGMSALFEWYEEDFVQFTESRGEGSELLDFLIVHAEPDLKAALQQAKSEHFDIEFTSYDWSLNAGKSPLLAAASAAASESGAPKSAAPNNLAAARPAKEATANEAPPKEALHMVGIGEPVANVSFPLAGGGQFKASDAKGKVLLLDFWATYCKPCRKSFPRLDELAKKHPDDLVIVAISHDGSEGAVKSFTEDIGVRFAIAMDPKELSLEPPFSVQQLPTELVIDRKGIVRHRHEGMGPGALDRLMADVEALIAKR